MKKIRVERMINSKDILKSQRDVMKEKYLEDLSNGLSIYTICIKMDVLRHLALNVPKPFNEVTKKDLINYFACINGNYKEATTLIKKIQVKHFFKWLGKPEVVEWIINKRNNNYKLPEELLNEDEVKLLVDKATNTKNRTVIMVLYDSAMRLGEMLNLKIKHVTFDEYGCSILIPKGKTGSRKIRLIDSSPYLRTWLSEHPDRHNPESYVFVNHYKFENKQGLPMSDVNVRTMLGRTKKRAKIKKRVYPHIFRHSRLTKLASELSESELKIFAGWSGASNMPRVYIHLSGEDLERKMLENRGLLKSKDKAKNKLEPKPCPRCNEDNEFDNLYCKKCWLPLTMQEAKKEMEVTEVTNAVLQKQKDMQELDIKKVVAAVVEVMEERKEKV